MHLSSGASTKAQVVGATSTPSAPAAAPMPTVSGRAPVVDQHRRAGMPTQPPSGVPAPVLVGPLPGGVTPRKRSNALTAFISFMLGALLVGAAFGMYALGSRDDSDATADGSDAVTPVDIRAILDKAQPSVVTISTGHEDSIFGGSGSGVIISEDGLILTNAHVIASAGGVIEVRFDDGTIGSAALIGADTRQDIALIKAERNGLTAAILGSSANLQVGDDVVAIGNALNLGGDPSVTRGIVSAKDRSITDGNVSLEHLIQTDAAINPGNSGGPLVDSQGRVVGINTAIIEGAQNVGFSIAIDSVKDLLPKLKAGQGDLNGQTGLLGIRSVTVDADLDQSIRDDYGIVTTTGALVAAVEPESPAEDGGLEVGDVIVEVDGETITTNSQLTTLIRARAPGEDVTITVERQGRARSFDVTLGSN